MLFEGRIRMMKRVRRIKKLTALVLVTAMLTILLSACSKKTDTKYFEMDVSDYQVVADYLIEHYLELVRILPHEDVPVYRLNYLEVNFENFNYVEELGDALLTTKTEFAFAWLDENKVVFWKDATMQLGILYTDSPKAALEEVEKWRNKKLDSEKINDKWLTIGMWD